MCDKIFAFAVKAIEDAGVHVVMESYKCSENGFEVVINEGENQAIVSVTGDPATEEPKQKGVFTLKISGAKAPEVFGYTPDGLVIFAGVLKKKMSDWREKVLKKSA